MIETKQTLLVGERWSADPPRFRRTLSQFHGEKIHVLSFFHGTGIFLLTFCISMALGVIFGLSCSLMLKHSELGTHNSKNDLSQAKSSSITMQADTPRSRVVSSF